MNKKYQLFNLCSLFLIILLCYACKNCCEDISCVAYNFKIPITIADKIDSLYVGDTITFLSTFHHDVEDIVDNRKYKLVDYNFGPGMDLTEISQSKSNGLFESFATTLIESDTSHIFHHSDTTNSIAFKYRYENDYYFAKVQFIIHYPGTYYFRAYSDIVTSRIAQNTNKFEGRCAARGQDPLYFMNDSQDNNNYHLLAQSGDPDIRATTKERFDRFGGYAFVVKE